jgi:hypothetical protein
MVIDNVKSEHFKWLTEMAKTLNFKVVEVELTEDEEDAYLLAAMEEIKDETPVSDDEAKEFENWLSASAKKQHKISI